MTARDRFTVMPDAGRAESGAGAKLAADLISVMHQTARRKRERLVVQLAQDAGFHVQGAWLRGAAESRQLTMQAEQDVEDIHLRTEALISRLRADSEHEIALRRRRLARSLDHHVSILNSEVERVLSAVDAYRASLDRFFDRLAGESEISEIVRLAGSLPAPPDLAAIRELARAGAMAELAAKDAATEHRGQRASTGKRDATGAVADGPTTGIGVMDAGLVGRGGSGSAPAPSGSSREAD